MTNRDLHPSTRSEDAGLIRRIQSGDRQALDDLVRRHYARVFSLAYRLCRNRDDAQDLVSEVFIRVQRAIPRLRSDAYFSTWLYRVVRNAYLDEQKRRAVRATQPRKPTEFRQGREVAGELIDTDPGPDFLAEQAARRQVIADAVLRLTERQRRVVLLHHFQDRTYTEIAEMLNVPISTVKTRLHRARESLKNTLGPFSELLQV